MRAVVGLGNPGLEYRVTRHNIGFTVVDQLAQRVVVLDERYQGQALVAHAQIRTAEPVRFLLVKPLTYMNRSGAAVARLVASGQVALGELLVVYDDLDLELGRLRLRPRGGSGGHRGVESIINSLGTDQFARLRCGIGRPAPGEDVSAYVLSPFDPAERETVEHMVELAVEAALVFLTQGLEAAMNRYNNLRQQAE